MQHTYPCDIFQLILSIKKVPGNDRDLFHKGYGGQKREQRKSTVHDDDRTTLLYRGGRKLVMLGRLVRSRGVTS
jgi:hypothetical protein